MTVFSKWIYIIVPFKGVNRKTCTGDGQDGVAITKKGNREEKHSPKHVRGSERICFIEHTCPTHC